MNIAGKKILFICPKFHGYQDLLKEQMEQNGAAVDFFPERKYNYTFTLYNNFSSRGLKKYQDKHYKSILEKIKNSSYDILLVIRGFMIPEFFIDEFKNMNPQSKTIMYQWDSQRTNPFIHLKNKFDLIKTFDFKDSEELSIKYLPLFYTKDINKYSASHEKKYDFFFMGVYFPERYNAIIKFKEYCEKNNFKLKSFLFVPFTTKVKLFFKGVKLDKSVISYSHMSRDEYLKTLAETKVMVDVSNPRQTGLAMRVIESLAMNIKVATNNSYFLKDTNITNSGAVVLFDLDDINFDESLIHIKSIQTKEIVMSVEDWINNIFEE